MPTLLFRPDDHPDLTFSDVFLVPNNPVQDEVLAKCTPEEKQALLDLHASGERMREHTPYAALATWRTYRNKLLELAQAYGIGMPVSRDDIDLTPRGGLANTPIMVANMNNVAGKRMAEAIARVGGVATLPQDKTDKEVDGIIEYLRSRHPVYDTPVSISSETKVHEFKRLLSKRSHDTAVVLNNDGRMLGVLSMSDIPDGLNEDAAIGPFFRTDDVVTGKNGITPRDALTLMDKEHVHYLPVLNGGDEVVGALTRIDAAMRLRYKPNLDQKNGGLNAIFTVGALNKKPLDRVRFLLDRGITTIQFDTAHLDQGIRPYLNVEQALSLAAQRGVQLKIIAGNMVTRSAVRDAIAAGAQFLKIGIGPGAMCTTRMQTGVGRPQVSAVLECADEAKKYGGYIISDGGLQYPRDVSIAMAAGADYVMSGSLFAGTYESPPDMKHDEKGFYKENYGMASGRASVLRTLGRSERTDSQIFRDIVGHRSEGISNGKVYLKPGQESVALMHHHLIDGAASGASYAGAKTLQQYPDTAIIGLQTGSGYEEGKPKHVS